ncbi:J domain-containing protein [Natranaerofaba carboxydovora]|uniref:J domain-containing protein n=1 Tax=Natranaerofaba carboxydovora TaxID=2742683 RepID=UPI001F1294C1|nr:J domain-containing protein [Natranaerofaba carboxydovora]UMZ74206.1 DnaJ-like protein [Natranaerofaba carboxydovora]
MDKYYKILGINKDADQKEIKKAYYNLVKEYHPDMHVNSPDIKKAEKEFIKINEAYCILTNTQTGYCKMHPSRTVIAKCVFCNNPLCEECCSENGIISCLECYKELQKGQLELLKKPLINTAVGIVIGVLFGNVITHITNLEENFVLSIIFSVYFVGLLWYLGETKTKRRSMIFYIIYGIALGWIIGVVKALFGFGPAFVRYIKKINRERS